MAENPNLEIEETDKSKKKLIVIIAAALFVVGVVVVYLLMSGSDASEGMVSEDATAATEAPVTVGGSSTKAGTALYVAMPRPFVFNVLSLSKDKIVQIKVQLLVRGSANEETAKKHIPLIEGKLLSVFSTATVDELSTSAGKETLRFAALEKVQAALIDVEGSKVIERVLFTGFVMQ